MGLVEYRRKRDFQKTREPRGGRISAHQGLSFVIHKHAASHLHYDFRLELDGVLKSWAVPKGPSLDPAVKRLAMHVEDHPLEYGGFEGIIPQGEYGGGTVMLWDRGTWEPVGDAREGYRAGALKFVLHGEKLHGGWMLVRKGGRRAGPDERTWFLFKERDKSASTKVDVTVQNPLSVSTGRDLDEIGADANRVWGPSGEVKKNGRTRRVSKKQLASTNGSRTRVKKRATASTSEISALLKAAGRKAALPKSLSVELATLVKTPPEGDGWIHEIKFDGYRMLARIENQKVRLISRNGKDWTAKFAQLMSALGALPLKSAIIDGEVVVMQPDGTTSFQALQNAFQDSSTEFLYYAFDLLYLDGYDLRRAPIENRKGILRLLIPENAKKSLQYSEHIVGHGDEFFAEAARRHLEGIVSKRLGKPYTAGRGLDWLKIKCALREEFVIGGFTKPGGARAHFGALLLGYYDKSHDLQYAGRVGTGFSDRTLAELHEKLAKHVQARSPFANLSGNTGQARDVTWVKPTLVAQIEFSNWTDQRQLRHPSFQGLREDKAAKDVVRDVPVSLKSIKSSQQAEIMAQPAVRKTKTARKSSPQTAPDAVAGVRLSHPDKVMYPADGITKLDLARYYEMVAEWMLPHVENRLLSLVRCPGGSGAKCFFQKHPGEGTPEVLRRFEVREKNKVEEYLALYNLEGLVSLVQMGVLEIHLWGSQADQFEKPDRLILDLDPDPSVAWPDVVTAAKQVRLLLEELDLDSFVKTTGGKGLHIVVPVRRTINWQEAKSFCRAVAEFLVAADPDRYIAKMSKAARKGKIFVDYLRNDRGATAVAPYSTRARPGAPVSVPITWDELTDRLTSNCFTVNNLAARLARLKRDPWTAIDKTRQAITASMLRKLAIR